MHIYICILTIGMYILRPKYFSLFYFYFHLLNNFQVGLSACTSIFHKCNACSSLALNLTVQCKKMMSRDDILFFIVDQMSKYLSWFN